VPIYEESMKPVLILGVCIFCVVVVMGLYWRTTHTYGYEVRQFEATVRARVSPGDLQKWATNLLARYAASNVVQSEYASFELKSLPPELTKGLNVSPTAFLFANPTSDKAFIRVSWGSGFRGHLGLDIGATNFIDPYAQQAEPWIPGVNFWREHRNQM
jgi:hypothetical protein